MDFACGNELPSKSCQFLSKKNLSRNLFLNFYFLVILPLHALFVSVHMISWLARPGIGNRPIYLALGHVVPAKGADDEAGVARVGLGAVAGVPRARHELPLHEVLILLRRRRHLGRRPGWKEDARKKEGGVRDRL